MPTDSLIILTGWPIPDDVQPASRRISPTRAEIWSRVPGNLAIFADLQGMVEAMPKSELLRCEGR